MSTKSFYCLWSPENEFCFIAVPDPDGSGASEYVQVTTDLERAIASMKELREKFPKCHYEVRRVSPGELIV